MRAVIFSFVDYFYHSSSLFELSVFYHNLFSFHVGTKEVLENRDREIANLRQQLQQAQKEKDTHKQRAEKAEKMLHETGARGDAELEQWRNVIEQETKRADQAEKTSQDLQKRIQVRNINNK